MSETRYHENISTLTLHMWFCWSEQTSGHFDSDPDNATDGHLAGFLHFNAQRTCSKQFTGNLNGSGEFQGRTWPRFG